MTSGAWEIVGRNYRELPIAKTIGDALRDLIRRRYANNAAKTIERDWDLDPKTAKNVVTAGHVSERTITKAVRAEGWPLLLALGAELTGETFEQFEERRLTQIIQEAEIARENIHRMAARRQTLEARTASALADLDGPEPHMDRGTSGGAGSADLERGPKPPRSRKA
jgi:hypothetical protein